jgi:hypothetical protein
MIKTYTINVAKAISETLDSETIIINLEKGTYYSMNNAGTGVWNAIMAKSPISIDAPGVADFINQLVMDELIQEINSPDVSAISSTPDTSTYHTTEIPTLERYTDMQEMLLADPIHDVDTAGWPKLKSD